MKQHLPKIAIALTITLVLVIGIGQIGRPATSTSRAGIAQTPAVTILSSTTSTTSTTIPFVGGGGGGGGAGGGEFVPSSSAAPSRVQAVSQGITGDISNGEFQSVAGSVLSTIASFQGYTQASDLTYDNGLWHGSWTVEIPSASAQTSLFAFQNLISDHGKVVSVNVSTKDVTAQVNGNASAVPYAPIDVELQEVSTPASSTPITQAFSVLTVMGGGLEYYGILAVPIFGLSLAAIFLWQRVAYPLLMRVWRKNDITQSHQAGGTPTS